MYKCTSISCLFSYINSCFASFRSKLYLTTKLLSYFVQSGSDKTVKSALRVQKPLTTNSSRCLTLDCDDEN